MGSEKWRCDVFAFGRDYRLRAGDDFVGEKMPELIPFVSWVGEGNALHNPTGVMQSR